MKKVDIGELNNSEDLKKYSKDTVFVLDDNKVILPPESLTEKKNAAGQ